MRGKLDRRSALSKAIQRRIKELKRALGSTLSPQKEWIITDVARCEQLLDRVDFYLSQVNPIARGKPRPALEIRLKLSDHIKDSLARLGLEKAKPKKNPWD